jgi:hypothetical protein
LSHQVTSIIRDVNQTEDINAAGAKALVLSLEDSPVGDFTTAFDGADVVYFSAGAGGKGGEARTKAIDYEGAVKVFDAIESIKTRKPRLILVSAVDIRDENKIPAHYVRYDTDHSGFFTNEANFLTQNDADKAQSERIRKVIPAYMKWKYEADKNLIKRTAFKWFILRPGGLTDNTGAGTGAIGRTHITETVSVCHVALGNSVILTHT